MAAQPQSPEEHRAEERRWYGDRETRPGRRLTAESLSAHELRVLKLRLSETPTVARLDASVAAYDCELRDAAIALVKATDRLNCILAGIIVQDGSGGNGPDLSGLGMDGLRAKRTMLVLAAKRATCEALAGRLCAAAAIIRETLDECFPPGTCA